MSRLFSRRSSPCVRERVLVLAGFLVLASSLGAAQTPASSDSLLSMIQTLYDNGSYVSAELEARRLLDMPALGDSARMVASQYIAFSLIAQGKNASAVEHFVTILNQDSTYSLDPMMTSPKIMAVFEDAVERFARERLAHTTPVMPPANIGPEPGPSFRLLVFPGWDQMHQGRTTKGIVLLSAGAASVGAVVTFDILRRSARDKYLKARTPDEASAKYKDYDRYYKAEYYSAAALIVVYAYSAFDAFFDLPPRLDARPAADGTGVQISLAVPF